MVVGTVALLLVRRMLGALSVRSDAIGWLSCVGSCPSALQAHGPDVVGVAGQVAPPGSVGGVMFTPLTLPKRKAG